MQQETLLLGLINASAGGTLIEGDKAWVSQAGLLGEAVPHDRLPWEPLTGSKVGGLTWVSFRFDAPSDWASPEPLALDLTGAGKGHIYINGFDAGRYWVRNPVLSTYYQLPPDNLLHKGNQLVLWEELGATLEHVRVVRRAAAALL